MMKTFARTGRKLAVTALATLTAVGLVQTPALAAATPQGIVDVAAGQLGGKSCNPGYFGSCGKQWCAEFARWVWDRAGVADTGGLDAWAQSFKSYGTSRGLYHSRSSGYTPQPGDAVVFDWERSSGDDHPIDHVAIVTSTGGGRVYTIGGNQGGGGHLNSKVTRSSYQRSDVDIDGYVTAAGVSGGGVVDEPNLGYSVTGDSFADLIATKADGTMLMYSNNIIRDEGVPYSVSRQVGRGWGSDFNQVVMADATGDGYTDLVARKTDGTLWLYANNIERDNGDPYSVGRQIGHGWNGFDKLVGADVTGDGFTDLVARKPDGTLWLYPNNIVRDNGMPYSGGSKQIGFSGWNAFDTLIGADVTGDGFVDLVGRKADGTLTLYPNNIVRDNGLPYSGGSREIGSGWNEFTAVVGADVTGDGFTDMVVRKTDGTLWLYPNNIGRDNGVPYSSATAEQIGFGGWNAFDRLL
ncbi:CHAP domain-containing protein [Actinoplanes sp. M2I2]|uniref:CHAP domain-containing protein n=1 Tax=Actinoplanes sp. M2I2 TaxID=1734444 RepID=UPI0020218B54|nr:CHAP domain-containing protein [Actinoplanes sp. M2I2]